MAVFRVERNRGYYTALVAHDMASGAWAKPKGGIPDYTCNEGESL